MKDTMVIDMTFDKYKSFTKDYIDTKYYLYISFPIIIIFFFSIITYLLDNYLHSFFSFIISLIILVYCIKPNEFIQKIDDLKFKINSNNEVEKIGKINTGNEEVHVEFIGMIKLKGRGAEIFKEHFHRLKKIYWNKPFQRAKTFQKAYLTDFIQELVDIGTKVHCVIIESGWKEIDTVEDYSKALSCFSKKFIKK